MGLGLAPIGAQVTIATAAAVTVDVEATVTLSPGYTVGQVQPLVEAALEEYLLSVRKGWGTPVADNPLTYEANVYAAQVLVAIVGAKGIINVTDVMLNGGTEDLTLTESGTVQQAPVLGTVVLHA